MQNKLNKLLQKILYKHKKDVEFGRNPEIQTAYILHQNISKELGFINGAEYAREFYDSKMIDFRGIVLCKNRFPYFLNSTIEHYLAWIHPNHEKVWSEENLSRFLKARFGDRELIFFQNSPKRRSIESIKHYHVFVVI
jgi:hypothetical protein